MRRTTKDEVDVLYPACVAMYTEEVGVSPEWDGGRDLYRARVTQLIWRSSSATVCATRRAVVSAFSTIAWVSVALVSR